MGAALGRQEQDRSTLVIYSGPTSLPSHSEKSQLYHRNLESFLELGVTPHPQVHTAIVLTRLVSYLEPAIVARGAHVYYRQNVCYDMESVRTVLAEMRTRQRKFAYYIVLNCGMFGPTLPAYLLGVSPTVHWTTLLTATLNETVKLVGMTMCCGGVLGHHHPHLDSSLWATDAKGLGFIEEDKCIYKCHQEEEGKTSKELYEDIVKRYEMGMSQAMRRRGYHLSALNLLQRNVDWRRSQVADGCARVTRTCYYDDYAYGPPDQMFTKLTASEFEEAYDKSTFAVIGPMYNGTWRRSREFRKKYGFLPADAPHAHWHDAPNPPPPGPKRAHPLHHDGHARPRNASPGHHRLKPPAKGKAR